MQTVYSMHEIEPLQRANVSESVAAAVRAMIVDGRLAEGERINEVRLSEALGVSRTPLREALNRLAAEGAITSAPGLGYRVRPLTVEEFDQLYDIRPILDPEALRMAGLPDEGRLARLEKLNRAFASARDPEAAIDLDDRWHMELIGACPNKVLIEMIQSIILRTRRYELALMRESANVQGATGDHDLILAALRDGDLERACAALKHNMQSGREPIVGWLRARKAGQGGS